MINIEANNSVITIKRNIRNVSYDATCLVEIIFYCKEVRKYMYGTALDRNFEEYIYPLLNMLNRVDSYIDAVEHLKGESLTRAKFELLNFKLHVLINDFTEFIRVNSLEESCISEKEMSMILNDESEIYL
jgi:hypothetical protein